MLYQVTVEVPADTPRESAVEKQITVYEDVLTYVSVYFRPGNREFLKVALFYGDMQVFPSWRQEWVSGEAQIVEDYPFWALPETPATLRVLAYNTAPTYAHGCVVRVRCVDRSQALAMLGLAPLVPSAPALVSGWVVV